MKSIVISGEVRNTFGKGHAKRMRIAGDTPCTLNAGGKPIHFTSAVKSLNQLIYTSDTYVVNLEIAGAGKYQAVLTQKEFDPIHGFLTHAEFNEVKDDKPVVVELPVTLHGTSPGMLMGGKLVQKLRRMRVCGLAGKLPEAIDVDVSELKLGKSITIRDLKFDGFQVWMNSDVAVCSIEITRALRQEAGRAGGK